MTGNHGVVSTSTKEFPPFRLRIQRSSDRGVVFSSSGGIEFDDVAELQRLLSLEAAGQGVEFIASDVYTKHLLRNLRSELKRSRMKGKQDGGGNYWTEPSRAFS